MSHHEDTRTPAQRREDAEYAAAAADRLDAEDARRAAEPRPDALHFGIVGTDGLVADGTSHVGATLSRLGAALVVSWLRAGDDDVPSLTAEDYAASADGLRVVDLAPVDGGACYVDGSFMEWGEPWTEDLGVPLALVVDLDGPATVDRINATRAAVARRLPGSTRLADHTVVTDREDHSERAATVGAWESPWAVVAGRKGARGVTTS